MLRREWTLFLEWKWFRMNSFINSCEAILPQRVIGRTRLSITLPCECKQSPMSEYLRLEEKVLPESSF